MEQRRPLCAPDKTSRPAPPLILQNTITLIFASQSAVLINKVRFSPLPAGTGPSPYTVPPARSPSSCSSSLFLHLQDESQRSQCHRTQTFTSPAPDNLSVWHTQWHYWLVTDKSVLFTRPQHTGRAPCLIWQSLIPGSNQGSFCC